LAWYEFGAPTGRPVLYFHGFPGSGVEAAWAGAVAVAAGVRLIGVDRPGYGNSNHQVGRTILSWPDDVAELADALALRRFAVLGMSGGGPYALACAARMADRTTRVSVVSGLGPLPERGIDPEMMLFNRFGLWAGQRPGVRWLLDAGRPIVDHVLSNYPHVVVARLRANACSQDRTALEQSGLGTVLEESFRRAVRSGARGMVWEAKLFAGFAGEWLPSIQGPVEWLHGEQDGIVPVSMARRAETAIPQCRARYFREEGHFSVLANHLSEVLGRA